MNDSVEWEMSNAISCGNLYSVEKLIDEYGLNYSQAWSEGFNLLIEALKLSRNRGGPEVAILLLTKGAEVNTRSGSASTPLHYAAHANHYDVVKELLERGAGVNTLNVSRQTPLHLAVSVIQNAKSYRYFDFNHKIIHLLVRSGANIHATDNFGGTPLLYAIKSRESKCVEMLIQYCTNIDFQSSFGKDDFRGYTPLQYAVRKNKEEVVKLLLEKGANANIGTQYGETALHTAANVASSQIAQALLNHGANINAVFTSGQYQGYTPLHTALLIRLSYFKPDDKIKLIEMFVTRGANANAASEDGLTPLHMATYHGTECDKQRCHGSLECNKRQVEILLKHGADPNILTKDNKTVLRIAVEKGSSQIVEHILKHSTDLNNDLHADILRVALFDNGNSSHDIIRQLLDYGFSVANEPNKASMFYEAVTKNCTAIVVELLKHGFQVNMLYEFNSSWSCMPLHLAVQKDRLSQAGLLISHGADVNALDNAGKTPISYVCREVKMLKLLLENGAKPKDNPGLLPSALQYYDSVEAIKVLVEHGVDVNGRDSSGVSALHRVFYRLLSRTHEADFKSSLQIVKLLLDNKADVNAKTTTEIAVLHIAAMLNPQHLELLQTLLEYNADVNIPCDEITPLHLCAFKGNDVFGRILLKKGADANAKLEDGKTAAHLIATENGGSLKAYNKYKRAFECFKDEIPSVAYYWNESSSDFGMIKALVEFGADLNFRDNEGKTPLHEAANKRFGGDTLIPILIKHGADWTSRDKHLKTPIHYAAQTSMTNVRILVEFGADINSKDADGCSPLHRLVQSGSNNVAGLLCLGSDVNVVNNDNQTPLEIAVGSPDFNSAQRLKVMDILKERIIELKAANLHVVSKNLIALESLKGGDLYNDHYHWCKREMDRIKVELIGESNVSFHDFLTSGRRELGRLATNDKLEQALQVEDFSEFPIYAPDFKLKVVCLRQAYRRSSLIETSKEVFVICIADLPDLCLDVILDELSDDDLENVIHVRYPFQVFPKTNDSKCEGYLSNYDYDRNDYDDDRYYDDDYYHYEKSDSFDDSDDSDRWRWI